MITTTQPADVDLDTGDDVKDRVIFVGVVDGDPRATDNAWLETTAIHCHFDIDGDTLARLRTRIAGADDAAAAHIDRVDGDRHRWYATHGDLMSACLSRVPRS